MATDTPTEMETLRDGSQVLIRHIRPSDVALEREFIENLSPESRRFRFLGTMNTPSEALLKHLTEPDAATEVAYIALTPDPVRPREVGVARYCAQSDGSAEIAVAVDDRWQGKGLATVLMKYLTRTARARGLKRLYSIDAAPNHAMRDLAGHLGFSSQPDPNDATQVIYSLTL